MMREDEKRPAIGASENYVERTFGNIDPGDLLTRPVINEDLPVRDVDVAVGTGRDASRFVPALSMAAWIPALSSVFASA